MVYMQLNRKCCTFAHESEQTLSISYFYHFITLLNVTFHMKTRATNWDHLFLNITRKIEF